MILSKLFVKKDRKNGERKSETSIAPPSHLSGMAMPSYLSGMARTLDIFGMFDPFDDFRSAPDADADAKAIQSDFDAVGRDMWVAIEKLAPDALADDNAQATNEKPRMA